MATHIRARESKGTACVVVVSGTRFESFFYIYIFLHVRACTSILNIFKYYIYLCVPLRAWPYMCGRTCKKKKTKKNCDVNCDVIAPCPVIGLVNKWP